MFKSCSLLDASSSDTLLVTPLLLKRLFATAANSLSGILRLTYCARRACSASSARRAGVAQAVTAAIAKTAARAARAAHAEAAFGSPYVPRPMLERAQVAAVPGAPVAPNVTAVCAPSAHRFRREHSIRCLYSLCRAHRLRCFLRTSRRARLCRARLCRLRSARRGIRASFAVPAAFASATSAAPAAGAARGSSIGWSTGCCLCCDCPLAAVTVMLVLRLTVAEPHFVYRD